jgi:hypothetical protein
MGNSSGLKMHHLGSGSGSSGDRFEPPGFLPRIVRTLGSAMPFGNRRASGRFNRRLRKQVRARLREFDEGPRPVHRQPALVDRQLEPGQVFTGTALGLV